MADVASFPRDDRGEWKPEGAVDLGGLFRWPPPNPLVILKRFFGKGGLVRRIFIPMAVLSWWLLTPSAEQMAKLRIDWIALLYVKNASFMILVAGILHLRLYIQRAQGQSYKYSDRWLSRNDRRFLFNNQTFDNVFFSLVSGASIWTLYEALTLWAYANEWIPSVSLRERPVYSALLLIFTLLFRQFHFYWTHRFTHWKPLYKAAHYLHHKNVNIGPWSGMSMHPIEHLIYLSGIFIHWVIPSHPVHAVYHIMSTALGPAKGHLGFKRIVVSGEAGSEDEKTIGGGGYFHYLHHKFFTVNFGNEDVPLDRWFRTAHDGSDELHSVMVNRRERARERRARQRQPEA